MRRCDNQTLIYKQQRREGINRLKMIYPSRTKGLGLCTRLKNKDGQDKKVDRTDTCPFKVIDLVHPSCMPCKLYKMWLYINYRQFYLAGYHRWVGESDISKNWYPDILKILVDKKYITMYTHTHTQKSIRNASLCMPSSELRILVTIPCVAVFEDFYFEVLLCWCSVFSSYDLVLIIKIHCI